MQNRNSLKLGQNYAYRNPKLLQLLRDFVPQTLYRGFAPGPHWGSSVPQTPCTGRLPTFCTRFTPLKVPTEGVTVACPRAFSEENLAAMAELTAKKAGHTASISNPWLPLSFLNRALGVRTPGVYFGRMVRQGYRFSAFFVYAKPFGVIFGLFEATKMYKLFYSEYH